MNNLLFREFQPLKNWRFNFKCTQLAINLACFYTNSWNLCLSFGFKSQLHGCKISSISEQHTAHWVQFLCFWTCGKIWLIRSHACTKKKHKQIKIHKIQDTKNCTLFGWTRSTFLPSRAAECRVVYKWLGCCCCCCVFPKIGGIGPPARG